MNHIKSAAPRARVIATFACLALLGACTREPPSLEPFPSPVDGWMPLFNGKDLEGWTPKFTGLPVGENYLNTFRVEDGLLKVSYADYEKLDGHNGHLFHRDRLSHYWLRAEYRFTGSKVSGTPGWAYRNSGIQLHSQDPASMGKDQLFPVSVELDLVGGRFIGSRPTGDVCRNGVKLLLDGKPLESYCSTSSPLTIRGDDWVTVVARVDGAHEIQHAVNGGRILGYTDVQLDDTNEDARRLLAAGSGAALESGFVSIQSNGAPIEFRRIDVLPIATQVPVPEGN